jgi:hypothetical protein
MMRNPGFGKKTIFAASFLVCFFVAAYSFAETLSSAELIENSKKYDGKTVTYIGEVIGDIMRRGNFSWVNISDGENAIGVWMSADMAKTIKFTGNYKSKGDKLKVTGIFNRACIQHEGTWIFTPRRCLRQRKAPGLSVPCAMIKRSLVLFYWEPCFLYGY